MRLEQQKFKTLFCDFIASLLRFCGIANLLNGVVGFYLSLKC